MERNKSKIGETRDICETARYMEFSKMRSELKGKDNKIDEHAKNWQENVAKWKEHTKKNKEKTWNTKKKTKNNKKNNINIAPFSVTAVLGHAVVSAGNCHADMNSIFFFLRFLSSWYWAQTNWF